MLFRSNVLSENYARWAETNVRKQKQAGYYAATVRLPLGDMTSGQMRAIGLIARAYGDGEVRVTPQQATVEYVRVVIPTDTRAGVPNGTVQHSYTIKAASAPPAAPSRLVNLSVRSSTGTGNDSLIVGLVVGGTSGTLPVLMRAAEIGRAHV